MGEAAREWIDRSLDGQIIEIASNIVNRKLKEYDNEIDKRIMQKIEECKQMLQGANTPRIVTQKSKEYYDNEIAEQKSKEFEAEREAYTLLLNKTCNKMHKKVDMQLDTVQNNIVETKADETLCASNNQEITNITVVKTKQDHKIVETNNNEVQHKRNIPDNIVTLAEELDNLGSKYKFEEKKYVEYVDKTKWTVLRVDGRAFHTFTKKYNKPIDERIMNAMVSATKDWIKEFNGLIGYTQSDESTVILPRYEKDSLSELPYGGRVSKLVSLSASYFTLMFNKYMGDSQWKAMFDCRIFQVDSEDDVVGVLRWRQLDGYRNGITSLAASKRSNKELEKLGTKQRQDIVREYQEFDKYKAHHILHGTFVKKNEVVLDNETKRKKYNTYVLGSDFKITTPTFEWINGLE